ncbi:MAG: hypothetical protein FJ090_09210, partial [Deltaproteobacteria bacterium]|nr:hypothetical protein [Deltaproteobacteria bacterium]
MLLVLLACSEPALPIVARWQADRAAAEAQIRAMPPVERALAIQALARAAPGETLELCEAAPDEATRADCVRINNRPHLRQELDEVPSASERVRPAPGPPSDRLPVPPPLEHDWSRGAEPACDNDACRTAAARERATRGDWPGVLGACAALSADKWREDCYFQAAEHAARSLGAVAYPDASRLCHLATEFRAQCQGHLANELSHRPSESVAVIGELWKEYPAFRDTYLDLYWSEHAMSLFKGTAEASDHPEAERYYRMERALARVADADVRPLWPEDEPGEDQFPAMRVRAVGRRAWSSDPAIDERICALEAEGAAKRPSRERLAAGLDDPEPVVRWT